MNRVTALCTSIALLLSGCSTAQLAEFHRNAAVKECTRLGVAPDSDELGPCIDRHLAQWESERQVLRNDLVTVAAIATAANLSANAQRSYRSPASDPTIYQCPDGSFITGKECYLAPNGTYLGGPPTLAPDGTFVVGEPRLAPNGKFVGSYGNVIQCPDGTYVAGYQCVLAPNGRFVGR